MTDGYKINKGYMWVSEPKIPSEYQEVEYIQSSGTQVIKTGVYMDTTGYRATLEYQNTSTSSSDQAVFGYYMNSEAYAYRTGYGTGNEGFTLSEGGTSLNKQTATGSGTTRTNSNYQFYIFAKQRYDNGNYDSNAYCKLYSCKIYNSSNELIRDFVPCYKKSDNTIGLYDKVGGQFYTNQGSGTFTKGNDVEPTYVFVEKQFYPGGGGGGGFVFEYDFTTKTKAEAIADGWHGEGGGDWSVSSDGAYFSRAQTDRSYVVSHPITLPSTISTMYLKSRFRGDIYSWAGHYSTTIKQTYTCGSGNEYPNDDYIQSCSASYNSNSGYKGYGTGCEPVTQSGIGGSGSIGSDWIDVESFYNLNAMTGWGKITRVSDGVELWTQSFSLNDISRITSKLGQDVYVCLFFRNGTYDNKWCKNVRVEIT